MIKVLAGASMALLIGSVASMVALSSHAAAHHRSAAPRLLYSAGGHLWLRPVDGRAARLIRTPWPMPTASANPPGAQWSPDSRRIALDDGGSRLAVINLASGHITTLVSRRCVSNCFLPNYTWSPSGRYLAILQSTSIQGTANLVVWDSHRGTERTLLRNVSAFSSGLYWSHDSSRVAVNTGTFDVVRSIYPWVTVVDLTGHALTIGKGSESAWSPDDRLIASIRSNTCGANTCDDDEVVRLSTGGPTIALARHLDSNFESPLWALQPTGYGFDRWLLSRSGHIKRVLAGPHERVDSWQPDGSHLAVQTYYPYESTPDSLYISTPQGARVRLYTDGPNQGCGACSKDLYQITWSHRGGLVAFATPTYPTPKGITVNPSFFLSDIHGGPRTRIPVPGSSDIDIMGFARGDRELIIRSARKVYRYDIPSHRLTTVLSGGVAGPGLPALDPAALK